MSEASLDPVGDPGDDGDDNQPTLIHNPSRHVMPVMVKNVPVPKAPAPLPRRSGSMPAVVPSSAPSSDGESTMALEGPSAFASVMGARAAAPARAPAAPPPDPQPAPNAFAVPGSDQQHGRSELESTQYLLAPSGQASAFAAMPAPTSSPAAHDLAPGPGGLPPEPSTLPYPPSASPFAAPVPTSPAPAPIPPQAPARRVPLWVWVLVGLLVLGGGGTAVVLLVLS